MIIYYFIFILLIALTLFFNEKNFFNPFILISVGILLFILAGFRSEDVSKDYETYVYSFNIVGTPIDYFLKYDQWSFYEPFYYFIPSVLKIIGVPYFEISVFIIFAIIGVFFNLRGIQLLTALVPLSLLQYYSHFFLLHEMTQIRAGVACGIFLCSIYTYYNKYWLQFIFLSLISFMFQFSGILVLLLLLFKRNSFSIKWQLTLIAIAIILVFLKLELIFEYLFKVNIVFIQKMILTLSSMQEDQNEINVFNVSFILNLAITIFLIFHHKLLFSKNKYSYLLLKIQVFSIFVYCALSPIAVVAFRLYEFLGIVNIVTVPMLIYCFRYRVVGYCAAISYALILFVLNLHFGKLVNAYSSVFF